MSETARSEIRAFEGLTKISLKDVEDAQGGVTKGLRSRVQEMHRAKEGRAYFNAADILPPDLAQRHGFAVSPTAPTPEIGEEDVDEEPDDFVSGRNKDITGDVLDPARQKPTPTMDMSSFIRDEEREMFDWIVEVVKNQDTSEDGRYGSWAEKYVGNLKQIMAEDRQHALRNPMQLMAPAPGYKAIINVDVEHKDKRGKIINGPDGQPRRGMLAAIATDQYQITQPRKAFDAFLEELEKSGVNSVYGRLEQSTRYHDLALIIDPREHPEYTIEPDDGRPIYMGFRLGGGFHPGRSTSAGGWEIRGGHPNDDGTWEMGCWNIFNLASAMGYVNLPHRQDEENVVHAIRTYITELENKGRKLLAKINNAIKTDVDDDMVEWVMQAAGISPAQSAKIKAVYKTQAQDEQGHMYGVYNAITQTSRRYSITRQENLFNKISTILDEPEEMLGRAEELKLAAIEEATALA
jgi:hypothetical protein